ncbi:MAG: pirin family protein [Kiritimatiellae bacterium]|nr:pirin family protein [Kiritimatiellia bacterium]
MNKPVRTSKRAAEDRGQRDHGWLQARFTFSFANYVDPDYMNFRALRVMNNDSIQPAGGFPSHPHRDMEILTYVIEGRLEHRDSMGNGAIIEAGNLQYMSAGRGVTHSEFNPSDQDIAHLYQIWLTPNQTGGEPRYVEKRLTDQVIQNELSLLFSGDGRNESTEIRQNADVYFGHMEPDHILAVPASTSTPHAWVQIISGAATVLGDTLQAGDGLAIENANDAFDIRANAESRLFVFRLS